LAKEKGMIRRGAPSVMIGTHSNSIHPNAGLGNRRAVTAIGGSRKNAPG
jgi:hypothetical protein